MFEIPFLTFTSLRFNNYSFDIGHVNFLPDDDNMYGYLPFILNWINTLNTEKIQLNLVTEMPSKN